MATLILEMHPTDPTDEMIDLGSVDDVAVPGLGETVEILGLVVRVEAVRHQPADRRVVVELTNHSRMVERMREERIRRGDGRVGRIVAGSL